MNPSTIIVCATVLSALNALPAQSTDGQAERVMQFVPVGYILADYDDPRPPLLGSFLRPPRFDDYSVSLLEQHSREQMLSIHQLVELVRQLSGEEFDQGTASLEVTGSNLVFSGSADVVRRSRRITEEIGRIVSRPIRLDVALYRSSPDADYPGVLSTGELTSLTRNLQLIWKGKSITRSGRQIALGRERYTSFVGGVRAVIAQKARIGDPIMHLQFEGLRVVVEPHALSGGGDLVVFCQFALGNRRGDMQSRSTGIENLPSLGAPRLASASGGMSARINSGETMLLGLGGSTEGGDSMLLAVSATFDAPDSGSQSGFALLPVSALTSTSMGSRVILTPDSNFGYENSGRAVFPIGVTDDRTACMTADELNGLVYDLLEDRIDEGEASVAFLGGFLMVRGQDSDRNRVLAFLSQLEDLQFQNQHVRLETRRQPIDASNTTFPTRIKGSETSEVLHSLSFPALIGKPHFVMRGIESTGITDFHVQIAQQSEQGYPIVDEIFSGLLCSVTPERTPDGLAADLRIRLIDGGEVKRRALEADWGGDLYLHAPTLTNFQHDGPLPESGVLNLGDGPIIRTSTQNWQTTQSITISGR